MSIELVKGEVIIAVRASLFRRMVAVGAMVAIGALSARAGLSGFVDGETDPLTLGPVLRSVLMMVALGMLYLAWQFWQSTALALELTSDELRDSNGRRLFALDDVARVDRGIFAMKPSNGVTIHLNAPGETAWQPGLWWRMGTRLGIGGITAPSQTRAIAETVVLLQSERNRADDEA